jgi:hypothetical protein
LMQLLNVSLLTVSTRRMATKVIKISIAVDLPRTKVLVEGGCLIKHRILYDE